MKINFAQVSHEDIDTFGEDSLFGPDESGNYYYNYVEFGTNPGGTEEVAIHDGCNRYMPVAVEHIPDLIAALNEYYTISQSLKTVQRIHDYVSTDNQAYVTDDTIDYEPVCNTSSWPFRN